MHIKFLFFKTEGDNDYLVVHHGDSEEGPGVLIGDGQRLGEPAVTFDNQAYLIFTSSGANRDRGFILELTEFRKYQFYYFFALP